MPFTVTRNEISDGAHTIVYHSFAGMTICLKKIFMTSNKVLCIQ